MSSVERRLEVAAHEIRGRRFLIERTSWRNHATLSYDVYDELTGLCLTPQSLNQPPTPQQLLDLITALSHARRDGTLDPFHHADRDVLTTILDQICPLGTDTDTDEDIAADTDADTDADVDANDPLTHQHPTTTTRATVTATATGTGRGGDVTAETTGRRAGDVLADGVLGPEPDASCQKITDVPLVGELGAHAFGRDIAMHVARLLRGPVTAMTFRENPWDRRPCPKAWFYEFDVADHRVEIACRETHHPLRRDSFTRYTLSLDGRPVPYQPNPYEAPAWQIAREIWIAWLDTATPPPALDPIRTEGRTTELD